MSVAARLKNLEKAASSTFTERISLAQIRSDLAKSGKKTLELYGADVLEWGHDNKALTEVLIESEKSGYGGHYAQHTNALAEFKKSAAEFQKRYRNVECTPDDIVPVPGIANGWNVIHFCLLDPGDEMLAIGPAHYFWGPSSYLHFYRAKPVSSASDEDNDWEPDIDDLRSKITNKTKAIVVDHPNNPTGAVYSEKAMKGIVDLAGEHGLPVISDEIYDLVLYDETKAPSAATFARDVPVVTMYSTSKFLMKPGWRLGYICLHDPKQKISGFRKTMGIVSASYGHGTSSLATVIMAAGVKAFEGPFEAGKNMVRKLQKSRDFTFKRVNEIDGVSCTKSRATMYAFPRVDTIGKKWKTEEEFVAHLVREEGLLFVPGSFFGDMGKGHFRTLFLPSVQILEDAYNRLESFLRRHSS